MNREEAKRRAEELVSKMTVAEKASQLRFDSPAIERLGVPEYNWWNEALHGVARAGVATMFPQAIGLAATFNAPMLQEIGDVISSPDAFAAHCFITIRLSSLISGKEREKESFAKEFI